MAPIDFFEEPDEDEEGDTCALCRGTGIGQFGDPNTSKCSRCHGRGVIITERDEE